MNEILTMLFSLSLSGSLLAVLLFAVRNAFKNKLSKTFSYYIWFIVLIRLVLPIGAPVNLTNAVFQHVQNNPVSITGMAYNNQPSVDQQDAQTDVTTQNRTQDHIGIPDNSVPSEKETTPIKLLNWFIDNLFWVWLAGAFFTFGWFVTAYTVFTRRIRRSCIEPFYEDAVLFAQMYSGSRIQLQCSCRVSTPMLIGVFKQTLVLPRVAYVKNGMSTDLINVLRHELTHYRRKDTFYKWFVILVTSVHWFNPLMIVIRKEISNACELSCDETVIRNIPQDEKQSYGNTLLAFASKTKLPAGIIATTLCEEGKNLKRRLKNIMNYKKTTVWAVVFMLALTLFLTGCAAMLGGASGENDPKKTPRVTPDDAVTIYENSGKQFALPNERIDQLIVKTDIPENNSDYFRFISVYEKRSVEASKEAGFEQGYFGFLFAIVRYTQAQYERYLSSDGSGLSFFAKDDEYYYGKELATDVRFYGDDGLSFQESAEWNVWVDLQSLSDNVAQDMVSRNNLTAYSDNEFWDKKYTYDGDHILINYYPYYTVNGSKDNFYTFILSQPVKQSEDGIWCVERFIEDNGNKCIYFPDSGRPSADYYADLQKECDAGNNTSLLVPMEVAMNFAINSGFWGSKPVLESFEIVESE